MVFVVDKPKFLIITIYGAFYICDKYAHEKTLVHLTNCWFVSLKGKNQFFENVYVRYKVVFDIVKNSPFKDGTSSYREIYSYLNKKNLISEKIKERHGGMTK